MTKRHCLTFNDIAIHIVAYHLYKGSCFWWLENMWRAYVKVVFHNANEASNLSDLVIHFKLNC